MIYFLRKVRSAFIRFIDWLYFPSFRFIPPEIFRYGITGGMNTLLDLLLYFTVYRYVLGKENVDFGFVVVSPHIAAFLFVFPVTFTTGFIMAKYVTFKTSELQGRIQLFRYGVTVAGAIILNYVFLKLFVEYFGWYATFSKLVTTVIVIMYSYFSQRYFSFKTAQLAASRKVSG